jgi:HlyD family secretion protein
MAFFNKIKEYAKKHKLVSSGAVIVVILIGYFWYRSAHGQSGKIQYVTQAVQKTTITVAVTATGQVSGENSFALKPGGSGALVAVDVKQGATVKAGQTIAVVDEKNNLVALNQAKASLASAQANYDKVVAGATSADLASSQLSVTAAQSALDNAKTANTNIVAQQKVSVNNAFSSMMNAGLQALPAPTNLSSATATISGTYSSSEQGSYTVNIYASGNGPAYSVSGLETMVATTITRGIPQAIGSRGLFITFGTTGTLSAGDTWTVNIPNIQSNSYLSAYNSYQAALQSQTQAVANAEQAISSAQNGLDQANAALTLKAQPAAPQDVEIANAQVLNAQAGLQNAELNYDNNIIKSPFDGVLAQLNNQVGDQVGSATTVATVITKQQVAVVSLNEVDVAKIQLDQKVSLTFDAIDGLTMTGHVAQIDTIGTVTQGVVTYNVKIAFDTQDDRVKPGMSVNASILTNVKTDVLAVPNAAVKSDRTTGNSYVQILDASGQPQNQTVQTGISNDTLTEITGGLQGNEEVVVQTINPNAKTSTTSAGASSGLRIPGLGAGGGFGGGGGAGRAITTPARGN